MRTVILFLAPVLASASPPPAQTCSAPIAVPPSVTTPNATYYNDGEPPKRFSGTPKGSFNIAFGQEAINDFCGRPPCRMVFLGCARGNRIALPDPFTTDSATFAKIVRHEMAHLNGWPDTHGD